MFIEITGDTYGVGDIHGDTAVLQLLIKCHELNNCTLILLGDIGIWRYRDYKHYMALDALAAERNITIYAFRGNHDNPAFFNIDDKSSPIASRFWNKFTNFKYIPDLSVVTINGKRGIVIGGGLSIDRCFRHTFQSSYRSYSNLYKKNDWWVNEGLPNTNHINETPTMPTVLPCNVMRPSACSRHRAATTYCATLLALQPGQLVQPMPASFRKAVSMWSKPMVAVAMNCTLLPSSSRRSQRVRVRMIRASA